jgi:hypothetical protein
MAKPQIYEKKQQEGEFLCFPSLCSFFSDESGAYISDESGAYIFIISACLGLRILRLYSPVYPQFGMKTSSFSFSARARAYFLDCFFDCILALFQRRVVLCAMACVFVHCFYGKLSAQTPVEKPTETPKEEKKTEDPPKDALPEGAGDVADSLDYVEKDSLSAPRVWLTVEVLEQKPSLGANASAFNEFIPVVIIDSATNAYFYALSGEMVEVGQNRTYFISLVSDDNASFLIQGAPVQVVRTGEPEDEDIVYQREFIIRATVSADAEAPIPENIVLDAPPAPNKPQLKADAATLSYNANALNPCPYVIQFCALSLEKDALQIRDALRRQTPADKRLADARVEEFFEKVRNIRYQRVRAGCFAGISEAKEALQSFSAVAKQLKLGVVPIVVKSE